ncbi:MAG: PadR family transcriptional regulator [Rhodospirillales bacterium]|nr:PadR family transcriptional regulator [Rhodospirillales bacterium]
MHHTSTCGFGRRFAHTEDGLGDRQEHRHGHEPHRRGFGRRRPFDHGELRLLTLAMIASEPRHGYELMKGIEERLGGTYSPSPGVIYPTLSWLEDMGFVALDTADGGRKRYRITTEGEAFLAANRSALEALEARLGSNVEGRPGVPAPVVRGMENLKLALRLRLGRGSLTSEAAASIAGALDAAAVAIERS